MINIEKVMPLVTTQWEAIEQMIKAQQKLLTAIHIMQSIIDNPEDEWDRELLSFYDQMLSRLEAIEEDWISVEERIPENGDRVLCLTRNWNRIVEKDWEAHTDQNGEWFKKSFSHWLPKTILPPQPK